MCELLGVNRGCYYKWLKASPSLLTRENQIISAKIKELFTDSRGTYGTRRLKKDLAKLDFNISRRRIARLMFEMSLSCKTKKRFKATTDSNHNLPVADNLLSRRFNVNEPNTHYVGDITYIPTSEGWLYLAVVIDLFSRKVVGWAMDDNMKSELVNKALLNALWQRKPRAGLIWHTDRGSQYASASHRQILKQHAIKQSMSRKGNCWDNAVSESFFHTLKTELTHHCKFRTRESAKAIIFEYIEVFYNRKRMHSANDYLSPEEYELAESF